MGARGPAIAILAALAALALPGAAAAQGGAPCTGRTDSAGVPTPPAPQLRYGINPAGDAGVFGPTLPEAPEQPDKTLAALQALAPPGRSFVMRLNRFFWSDGEDAFRRFLELTERYTSNGFPVEIQVRYHPRDDQEGDIAAWVRHVREVVRRFGRNRRVLALQITNEVNLEASPDSSDGSYERAKDALIQGVIAAKAEARRLGMNHLTIGFNWFYRTDPGNEREFWEYLRDHGGQRLVQATDWIGVDLYPGTFFPPAEAPGEERDAFVNAFSVLRECFLPIVGFPLATPLHVEENGWPTDPPARPYERQAQALETMVRAAHDFRGTYNVTDYRWFDLRDENSASPNFQQQYGILRDDYTEKPAFAVYRALLAELAGSGARPSVKLAARCTRRSVRLRVTGRDAGEVAEAEFFVDGRRVARDTREPFTASVSRRAVQRPSTLRADVLTNEGARRAVSRRAPACAARAAPRFTG
jgi:hypothetical protein